MIIDFHTHAFNPKIAFTAVDKLQKISGLTPYTGGLVEQLTDRMDEWGVDKSVMLSIATKPQQQKIINDWSAQINSENERIIAFGTVHPRAENALEEIGRIKELGLYGIKLHPDYQRFMVDDPQLDDIYACIAETGLPVIFHAGFDCMSPELIHCPPVRSLNMIKHNPKLKVILAHLGGNAQWDEVYDLLAGVDGEVYFDTSFTADCPDELMQKIIDRHGADRILLGSDCPWESAQKMIEKIMRLRLSDDSREAILGGNAARLLGIKT
jgi:hypothetical protein